MENNTQQQTIQKLENAINTLLGAYEVLKEKSNAKDVIMEELKHKINLLENNIETIEDKHVKQNSTIGNMLGRIESILEGENNKDEGNNISSIKTPIMTKKSIDNSENKRKSKDIEAININDIIVNPDKIQNKFDEDRMNKLLAGYN
jgi:FtsZ-binding cell division protein ZapB